MPASSAPFLPEPKFVTVLYWLYDGRAASLSAAAFLTAAVAAYSAALAYRAYGKDRYRFQS